MMIKNKALISALLVVTMGTQFLQAAEEPIAEAAQQALVEPQPEPIVFNFMQENNVDIARQIIFQNPPQIIRMMHAAILTRSGRIVGNLACIGLGYGVSSLFDRPILGYNKTVNNLLFFGMKTLLQGYAPIVAHNVIVPLSAFNFSKKICRQAQPAFSAITGEFLMPVAGIVIGHLLQAGLRHESATLQPWVKSIVSAGLTTTEEVCDRHAQVLLATAGAYFIVRPILSYREQKQQEQDLATPIESLPTITEADEHICYICQGNLLEEGMPAFKIPHANPEVNHEAHKACFGAYLKRLPNNQQPECGFCREKITLPAPTISLSRKISRAAIALLS